MSAKHTPGPWSVGGKYAHKTVLLNARGESIASGGNNRQVQGEELEASLRLAAAAPELLEFVRELASGLNATTRDLPPSIKRDAKALIAKATGSEA